MQETKTPSEAFDLAIRMELSLANTRQLNKTPTAGGGLHNSSGTVNAIQRQNQGSRGQFRNRVPGQRSDKCYRCGSPNCDRKNCKAIGATCYKCQGKNHFGPMCRTKPHNIKNKGIKAQTQSKKQVDHNNRFHHKQKSRRRLLMALMP